MKGTRLIITVLVALMAAALQAGAKTLELHYIAHDHNETDLAAILDRVRSNTRYNEDRVVIFYLANGNQPLRLRVSPQDDLAYSEFRETLISQTSHNVYPEVDRYMIMDMLSEGRFIPTKGFDDYDRVVFNYYINEGFVAMDFCDALIGRLFWDLEMNKIPRNKLEINIFHAPGQRTQEDRLFGRKNLMGSFPVLVDSF